MGADARSLNEELFCLFVEPSTVGGAMPTIASVEAKYTSADNKNWIALSDKLSPVTGKIDKQASALVFSKIDLIDNVVDLWMYADYLNPTKPIKTLQGASTVCGIRADLKSHPEKMKSRYRRVVAIATIAEPYSVHLK